MKNNGHTAPLEGPETLTQSYVHGASVTPLLGETVGVIFDQAVARRGDAEALVVCHQNVRWSWRDLKQRVDACAAGLLALGLRRGDTIGIWAPNCAEWVVTQFATAKAGLVLVNINPAYRLGELEYSLNRVQCKALITASAFKKSDYLAMLRKLMPEIDAAEPGVLYAEAVPSLRIVIRLGREQTPGLFNFDDLYHLGGELEERQLGYLARTVQFDDPVNIQFTSGTTGLPKAATLTHHNIVNNALFTGTNMRLGAWDRLCIPVPLYHCFGMVLGTLVCVVHGATMVFPAAGFDAEATLATIQEEVCTAVHGVPTMFIAELETLDVKQYDLNGLRTGIMAGAPCPIALMNRVVEEMGLRHITIAYGMTETGPVSFQTSVDDSLERRVTTVGRVLPHTEVKIVDEEGRIVPPGTPGELCTRGYGVMHGYWGDPEHTAEAIDAAGWMHSGDIATLDAEGYCNIVGRLKDMIIRGGENLFPREIEEYLYQHPKIESVEVFGVPDAKYGEAVCAWIKLHEGEQADEEGIRAFCRERIAHYKIPRYIRFVEAFPLTVTGKVQKFRMREMMMETLGAVEEATA